jgi:endonuclease/exonuclease/phosphatase family metal-dependent hydrolase
MRSLHLVTLNLWHGLSPTHWLRFKTLEPKSRLGQRQQSQVALLSQLNADVVFLQEVNPVDARSEELSEKLNMNRYWARDNAGLKVVGLGPPFNLDAGLTTLLKKNHVVEWSRSIKLSGEKYNFLGQLGSLQWAESRRALLVSTVSPDFGRVLWVNLHLHHGPELRASLRESLENQVSAGLLSANVATEIEERISVSDERRKVEIQTLLDRLTLLKSRYSLIVMRGDMNSTLGSETIASVLNFGFVPLQDEEPGQMLTWDGETNSSNHQLSRNFDSPIMVDDLSFDQKTVDSLKLMLRDHVMEPRQIDYLWGWSSTGEFGVSTSELVGLEIDGQIAPSDHLGLSSYIQWSPRS